MFGVFPTDGKLEIILHGFLFEATRNCYIALKNLRKRFRPIRLWVDAICINQEDSKEKGQQVKIMGTIYSKAVRTWIWLGESSQNSDLGMKLVHSIRSENFSASRLKQDAKSWEALFHLVRRDWWTRLWIIQEALLSRRPVVRCGSKETLLDRFADLMQLIMKYQGTSGLLPFHARILFETVPFKTLLISWTGIKPNGSLQPWPIFSWMTWTEFSHYAVSRDRIFALLSLSHPKDREAIQIDYEKPDRDIFMKLTAYLVHENALSVLRCGRKDKTENFGLPSSAPDWSTQSFLNVPYVFLDYPNKPKNTQIRADGTSNDWQALGIPAWVMDPISTHPTAHISQDIEVLSVRGVVIDQVSSADASFLRAQLSTFEEVQKAGKQIGSIFVKKHGIPTVQLWENMLANFPNDVYTTSCGRYEAFWRSLIFDRTVDLHLPPTDYGTRFNSWIGRDASRSGEAKELFELPYANRAVPCCRKRAFAITNSGYIGLLPEATKQGDLVCVFHGGRIPFVLRQRRDGYYHFVGEAYVHEIMNGEGVRRARPGDVKEFWIK